MTSPVAPNVLNLGILAHVDAGKTSLTERLLHTSGVIDEIGSVDDGSTQTDSLALERQRGITIKSAVVSFPLDDLTVNLIDTPGHPDFIAEVERVLSVLDGAVLVVSAVEGVQAQTRVLMRTLRRLGIPTLIFVNKTDRAGARCEAVLRGIAERLTPAVVPMATVERSRLAELLAEHDEALLAAYVDDETALSYDRLRAALAAQSRAGLVHPVYFGSAMTGAGVPELIDGVKELLPRAGRAVDGSDADGPVSGTVFKVERGPAGEKIAYVRMYAGTVRVRDPLPFGPAHARTEGHARMQSKVTGIGVFAHGAVERRQEVGAGAIGKLWGLGEIRVGDVVGDAVGDAVGVAHATASEQHFAPPTLETVVVPTRSADRGALHTALTQLAEQDPLINLRQDELDDEISVSLYGEVQKEVIEATLADEFGIRVTFRETTTICIERVLGSGSGYAKDPDPHLGTVGLRVDPAPVGAGVEFRLEVELGSMPYAFFKAVEDTVRATLRRGCYGWEIPDCTVTMTHSGYWPRQSHSHAVFDKSMSSTGGDFRGITPPVLRTALREAGTQVHEPMHHVRLEAPADTFGPLMSTLARLDGTPHTQELRGEHCRIEGLIPAARVHTLERALPGLTRGEGVLESAFAHHQAVVGRAPRRWGVGEVGITS